jgi:predicted TIM-barrel fold metal-dependent hydrolase
MEKNYLIVDTDIHHVTAEEDTLERLPEPWRTRYAAGNDGPHGQGYWNPNGVMRADAVLGDGTRIEGDPEILAEHFFDAYNIDYGILNHAHALHLGVSSEPDFAAAVLSAVNDVTVEKWLPIDDRFRASILVTHTAPDLAVKEIHRLGDHPGVVQVLIPSASNIPLGNRFFHPMYEAAAEHHLPIALHPGTEGSGLSGAPTASGYPSSYFEWHTDLAANYMTQLVSLVAEGVFVKFPTLKVVLVEGGMCWLPPLMWRFDKNWKALRMTAPWLDRPPSEYIRDHILLTTQPLEEPPTSDHFKTMLKMFDAENMVMFSSDFPHWDGDMPDFAASAFPEAMRPAVMGGNAARVYGLPEREAREHV